MWKFNSLVGLLLLGGLLNSGNAQQQPQEERGSGFGIKTNAIYWGTATPNLGVELRLGRRWSLDAECGLHPFARKEDDGSYNKSIKHFRLHPELRYWFGETFGGHFVGLHVPYLIYNVADVKWLGTEHERHQGWGTGAGLSYGYVWTLARHWHLEGTLGVGYLYLESEKYPCTSCGEKIETVKKHYVGPTQAALNLIYQF